MLIIPTALSEVQMMYIPFIIKELEEQLPEITFITPIKSRTGPIGLQEGAVDRIRKYLGELTTCKVWFFPIDSTIQIAITG